MALVFDANNVCYCLDVDGGKAKPAQEVRTVSDCHAFLGFDDDI